ncbi:hypothetical protein V2J48_02455 [Staphylococcus saccharolyticus]
MNEVDYHDLLLSLEAQHIKIPPSNQLGRLIQQAPIQSFSQRDNQYFIQLKDEISTNIGDEKLNFIQFYPKFQALHILDAYSRIMNLRIKPRIIPLKLTFPLDEQTIINDLNLPKTSNHKDTLAFLYILQKLLLELKKCDLAFSLKNNQLDIRYPNHIIKLSFHFLKMKPLLIHYNFL